MGRCVGYGDKNSKDDDKKQNIVVEKLFSTLIPKNFLNFTNDFAVTFIERKNKQKINSNQMKYIKLFGNHSGYTEYMGGEAILPNVSHCIQGK